MIPWATLWGSASHGHMKAERWRAASPRAASSGSPAATRARTRSKARASGWTVAGWTAWSARERRPTVPQAVDHGRQERPAADLHDHPVQTRRARPGRRSAAASSQPSVSPPSIARPFRLPWQVKGTAPASIARRRAW